MITWLKLLPHNLALTTSILCGVRFSFIYLAAVYTTWSAIYFVVRENATNFTSCLDVMITARESFLVLAIRLIQSL